jgi:hypothetical protein
MTRQFKSSLGGRGEAGGELDEGGGVGGRSEGDVEGGMKAAAKAARALGTPILEPLGRGALRTGRCRLSGRGRGHVGCRGGLGCRAGNTSIHVTCRYQTEGYRIHTIHYIIQHTDTSRARRAQHVEHAPELAYNVQFARTCIVTCLLNYIMPLGNGGKRAILASWHRRSCRLSACRARSLSWCVVRVRCVPVLT